MGGQPKVDSVWVDKTSGDYHYKYQGIASEPPFKGKMHFVRVDFKTKEESEGGLWLGRNRFLDDMVPVETLSANPCCGHPTQYPSVWCDDCGYEVWSAARDLKQKEAA